MNIKKYLIGKLTALLPPAQHRMGFIPVRQAGMVVNYETALTYSAIWRCVNLISQTVAGLPWSVNQRSVDGKGTRRTTQLLTHPAYALLDTAPNNEMDAVSFRETITSHALTWGNGYAEIERDGANRPVSLWLIEPERVRVDRDQAGRIVYVVSNSSKGSDSTLYAEDMFHLKGLGYDGLTGYSVISQAAKAVGVGLATEQFGAAFFENGAKFSGVLKHPGTLGDEGMVNLRDSLNKTHGGPQNALKTLILEEGMEWQNTSIPPDDAQFLETRKFQIAEIARWYGVPLHKLNEMDRSTFSNIEHQSIEFVTDCLMPWVKRLEVEANIKLISPANRGRVYTKLNVNGLMRGDLQARGEWYTKMCNLGVFSPNDVRELEDLNPIPDGDKRLVQLNLTTLEKVGEEPEPQQQPQPAPGTEDDEIDTRMIEDAFRRITNRESKRLEQLENAKDYDKAVRKFYEQHADYVRDNLHTPLEVSGLDVDFEKAVKDYITTAQLYVAYNKQPMPVNTCIETLLDSNHV